MANPSKQKGTRFESQLVDYLNGAGLCAERKALHGSADEGDIRASHGFNTLCIEAKNRKRVLLAQWFDEAEREAEAAGEVPVLVIHRDGYGAKKIGGSYAVMRLDDLIGLMWSS